jgi:hypothetical protein
MAWFEVQERNLDGMRDTRASVVRDTRASVVRYTRASVVQDTRARGGKCAAEIWHIE